VTELIREIRAIKPQCLIAVDHEGGRVQRFKTSFTHLPAMAKLGALYVSQPDAALKLARDCGWLMAAELRCVDVDFSFAPVLDRDYGISAVIGDRAFSSDPEVVIRLAQAFTEGMHGGDRQTFPRSWWRRGGFAC
jgi:beta-N-acetylhexosaminidase